MANTPRIYRGKQENKWVIVERKNLAASRRDLILKIKAAYNVKHAIAIVSRRNFQGPYTYPIAVERKKWLVDNFEAGGRKYISSPKSAVQVDNGALKAAAEKTGIEDREKLVNYALKLLADADPSADFARQNRGVLSGLRLDI